MEHGKDFTIVSFKPHIRGPRSNKGKSHNYPKNRTKWYRTNSIQKLFKGLASGQTPNRFTLCNRVLQKIDNEPQKYFFKSQDI